MGTNGTKRLLIIALVLLGVFLASWSVSHAITSMYKQVTGIGNVDYSDEVTFTELSVASPTKVKVTLTSNAATVATHVYTITLYLDGVNSGTQTVTWTAGQIPGTAKITTFSGLTLGPVTTMGAEVTK